MNTAYHRPLSALLLGAALLVATGCGSSHRLADHDFQGRTAAVLATAPPAPMIFSNSGLGYLDLDRPLLALFQVGSAVVKESEVQAAQRRMDDALASVDIAARMAEQTLLRSARHLRYRPVQDLDRADYLLDLRIDTYGLVADSWDSAVYFVLDAEVAMVDHHAGRVIWKGRVEQHQPVSHTLVGLGPAAGNVFTAATLSRLSVDEMAEAFTRLADYAADHIAATLRHDYYRSRD